MTAEQATPIYQAIMLYTQHAEEIEDTRLT
jgi:hypothetical protein